MDLPKASSFTLDFLCKTKVEGLLGVPLLYDLCTMITATGPPKPPEKRGLQEVASSAIPVSGENAEGNARRVCRQASATPLLPFQTT